MGTEDHPVESLSLLWRKKRTGVVLRRTMLLHVCHVCADRQTETEEGHTDKDKQTHTNRQTYKQTDGQTDRQTQTHKQTNTHTQTDTDTDTGGVSLSLTVSSVSRLAV